MTTEAEVDDFFAKPGAANKNEPPRDSYGRYLLPDPRDGKSRGWQRATTLAKTLEDTYHLDLWKQRMVLTGIGRRPDLYALAASTPEADKKTLDKIASDARDAAGAGVGANMGTALHGFTAVLDRGEDVNSIPEQFRDDVKAYRQALVAAGIEPLPKYVERTGLNLDFEVAGTFDRVYRLPDGSLVIGDLKTQKTLDFGMSSIGIQLGLYANLDVIRDFETGQYEAMPNVRKDFALVVHLPVGEKTARIVRVDTALGYYGARLARDAREYRSLKSIASPWAPGLPSKPAAERIVIVNPPAPGWNDNSVAMVVSDPEMPTNGGVDASQFISDDLVELNPVAGDALTDEQKIEHLAKQSKSFLQSALRKLDPEANVSRYRKDLAAEILRLRNGGPIVQEITAEDLAAIDDGVELIEAHVLIDNAASAIEAANAPAPPDPEPSTRAAVLESDPPAVFNPFAPDLNVVEEDPRAPYEARMKAATSRQELADIWSELVAAGLQNSELQAVGGARVMQLKSEGKA